MIGKRIKNYTILEKIGEGGMGVVYKAHDSELERKVALKFLPQHALSNDLARSRFIREAQTAAALNHPNICTIHEIVTDTDEPFIVMEYIEGPTLLELIGNRKLEIGEIIDYSIQIAEGIEAAHENGIVHRDIKCSNIIITPKKRAIIMDFGLAKTEGMHNITFPGANIGTASYMSPEQARGETTDERTDVWSLGVVIYEMLTGKLPFEGNSISTIIYKVVSERFKPAEKIRKDTPQLLSVILRKALQKNIKARYLSITDMLNDLKALRTESGDNKTVPVSSDQRINTLKLLRQYKIKKALKMSSIVLIGFLAIFAILNITGLYPFSKNGIDSIAVLPFVNLSGDISKDYICDGITDDIIHQMTKIPGLRVISRTSVMYYKGKQKPVREIADELNVSSILEGSIQFKGEKMSINTQLIDAETDTLLWAEKYEKHLDNVLTLQNEVSLQIVKYVHSDVTPQLRARIEKPSTENPMAYNKLLKAKSLSYEMTRESFELSNKYLYEALEIDPEMAPAYVFLGNNYIVMFIQRYLPPLEAKVKALESVQKALEIDNDLAEAHAILGGIKLIFDQDFELAEKEMKLALTLNPGSTTANNWYGVFLGSQHRDEEALQTFIKLVDMDPYYSAHRHNLAFAYTFFYEWDKAEEQFKKGIELDPDFSQFYASYAALLMILGRTHEAINLMEQGRRISPDSNYVTKVYRRILYYNHRYDDLIRMLNTEIMKRNLDREEYLDLGLAYLGRNQLNEALSAFQKAAEMKQENGEFYLAITKYLLGKKKDLKEYVNRIQQPAKGQFIQAFEIALAYAVMGERDQVFYWLKNAVKLRDRQISQLIGVTPLLDGYRDDPRYHETMKMMNLE